MRIVAGIILLLLVGIANGFPGPAFPGGIYTECTNESFYLRIEPGQVDLVTSYIMDDVIINGENWRRSWNNGRKSGVVIQGESILFPLNVGEFVNVTGKLTLDGVSSNFTFGRYQFVCGGETVS